MEFKERNDQLINWIRITWLSHNKIYGLEVLESRLEEKSRDQYVNLN